MERDDRIAEICEELGQLEGPLLPILHAVMAEFGAIDAAGERVIASALNLSRAEVHGVVSFYHDFRSAADPRPEIQICRAEACQARGIESLLVQSDVFGSERVRITTVYCLGLCSTGPNARVGDRLVSRLDSDSLRRLVEEL